MKLFGVSALCGPKAAFIFKTDYAIRRGNIFNDVTSKKQKNKIENFRLLLCESHESTEK